jgi:hypothetical protein
VPEAVISARSCAENVKSRRRKVGRRGFLDFWLDLDVFGALEE